MEIKDIKLEDNKVIITDNQMKRTPKYIKDNPAVSLVFWKEQKGWRIDGKAEYHNTRKWLDFVKSLKENKGLPSNGTLIVNVNEVEEL